MSLSKWLVKKKIAFKINEGDLFHDGHASLYNEGMKKTYQTLINLGVLVIGAHQPSMDNPEEVFKDLENLTKNGGMCYMANANRKAAMRSPVACGPPLKTDEGLCMLRNHAPSLYAYVEHVAEAYKKVGKQLSGLWWTYYRKDVKRSETIWIPLGMMKPHCDRLGGSTDRVVATFGCNPNGKQKRMSFQYGRDNASTVWVNIHHGMFVCLSKESSGHQKFSFNDKKVKHGVDNAEGTWTVTMEFALSKN
mmetsp:Transcript_12130/g.18185  ORF Transcript_12130/g.18185 Transcript_12130/m.18185 type:complete len:249 (+) Transcript_12130:48-794(+)